MSNRLYDMRTERTIIDLLESKLYPDICSEPVRWYNNMTDQLKGKDCDLFFDDLTAESVDVKCAHDYVKTDLLECSLPTFAFELSFLSGGSEKQGWLYDTSKETKYYLLSWMWAKKKKDIELEDILKLECCLVERQKILYFLAIRGLYPKNAAEINRKIRRSGRDGQHMSRNIKRDLQDIDMERGFHFYYSKDAKEEKPINVIIYKKHLLELASKTFDLHME
ncbi:hypothetical protein SAMN04488696_1469 [Methanolobus profundi]|uniref:Uncharacterized protein n=2 Tax=Methanolobus profundi TaxID=487685 RepID=A0A1I4RBX8_9EURY|nr:hypothetical protein SAMN04488696_1469 [Methanolobus profundi]